MPIMSTPTHNGWVATSQIECLLKIGVSPQINTQQMPFMSTLTIKSRLKPHLVP